MADSTVVKDNRAVRDDKTQDDALKEGPAPGGEDKTTELSSDNSSKPGHFQPAEKEEEPEEPPKPSKFQEIWGKIGLDMGTVLMMFK
jgi:hypothetical protein